METFTSALKRPWKRPAEESCPTGIQTLSTYIFYIWDQVSGLIKTIKTDSRMSTQDIIVYAIVIAIVAFSFYRKYVKKRNSAYAGKTEKGSISSHGSGKDDDYEPYLKK